MKKLFWILLILGLVIALLIGCTPTVPSEGEGEGEGEGEEEIIRVVLVELFTQPGCAYCEIAEPNLEQLADEYERTEVVFLEERPYGIYALPEILDRYKWYFPSSSDRSTPNLLFNGLNQRIYHTEAGYYLIKSYIETELNKEAKITITAARSSDSTSTTITGTIKNISSSVLDNLVINGMSYKNRGQTGLKYSVTDIFKEQEVEVSALAAGESQSFSITIPSVNWDGNNLHGVIFVQDTSSSKKEVLQAKYID